MSKLRAWVATAGLLAACGPAPEPAASPAPTAKPAPRASKTPAPAATPTPDPKLYTFETGSDTVVMAVARVVGDDVELAQLGLSLAGKEPGDVRTVKQAALAESQPVPGWTLLDGSGVLKHPVEGGDGVLTIDTVRGTRPDLGALDAQRPRQVLGTEVDGELAVTARFYVTAAFKDLRTQVDRVEFTLGGKPAEVGAAFPAADARLTFKAARGADAGTWAGKSGTITVAGRTDRKVTLELNTELAAQPGTGGIFRLQGTLVIDRVAQP